MNRISALVLALALGCTASCQLLVGNEERTVEDGGSDAGTEGDGATSPADGGGCSAQTCVDTAIACTAKCATTKRDCMNGCGDNACRNKCRDEESSCKRTCGDACTTCASGCNAGETCSKALSSR